MSRRSVLSSVVLWPLPLLLAAVLAQGLRPVSLPTPPRPALRFHGAPAAIASLLWVQVAGRIPFIDRVTPSEVLVRERQLGIITRLDPENPEPWRYGTLGLALWGRPDLALQFARGGLERFPDDPDLRLMLHSALALNGPADTAARLALLLSAGTDQRLPAAVRLRMLRQAAFTALRDGRETQALAAARSHDDLAKSLDVTSMPGHEPSAGLLRFEDYLKRLHTLHHAERPPTLLDKGHHETIAEQRLHAH